MLEDPLLNGSERLQTTPMTWHKMWDIILKDVKLESDEEERMQAPIHRSKHKKQASFLDPRSKTVNREALAKSTNAVELNRVRHLLYTKKIKVLLLLLMIPLVLSIFKRISRRKVLFSVYSSSITKVNLRLAWEGELSKMPIGISQRKASMRLSGLNARTKEWRAGEHSLGLSKLFRSTAVVAPYT